VKLPKPSPGLIEQFKEVVASLPGVEPRKMFGYDGFFVNGNFAAGLWHDTCVFKLSDDDGARFMANDGAVPFAPMKGRVMTSWYEAPEAVSHDPEQLAAWCERARAFALTLPPKSGKPAKRKAAAKTAARKPAKTPAKTPAKKPARPRAAR
jgi:TfoX/Sxy family transcriptional regulator of competence genes